MPILETEQARQKVKHALREIRDACDADASERQDITAKYLWRELTAEFEAELLGADR